MSAPPDFYLSLGDLRLIEDMIYMLNQLFPTEEYSVVKERETTECTTLSLHHAESYSMKLNGSSQIL